MSEKFTVLDLFSGAGGLTEGFSIDKFRFLAHVEMDPNAARTLETRIGYHVLRSAGSEEIYYSYLRNEISREQFIAHIRSKNLFDDNIFVRQICDSTIDDLFAQIDATKKKLDIDHVNVLIGGPPCQAYSIMGRARDPNGMVDDPRNDLYLQYIAFLERYKPDIFVFENVPGIKSAKNGDVYKDLFEGFKKQGYIPDHRLLDAADFGVVQNRKREIIVGWKAEYWLQYPEFRKAPSDAMVGDLLGDLPSLLPGQGTDLPQDYRGPATAYLRDSGIRTEDDVLRNHRARNHNDRDREIYRRAIRELEAGKRLHYNELPAELITHKNVTSFLDRFKVVDPSKRSHSVVAHISKDGHYYIHPDIDQARSLTVREVARIQSFPDNYLFEGARREQFKQVGNAVPPMMAAGIAKQIHAMLKCI